MRHAVILAGGAGKRFWPWSRRERPKQFMKLVGRRSLLAQTVARFRGVVPAGRIWVVTSRPYLHRVREELPQVPEANLVAEPKGLNSGPAVLLAAVLVSRRDPEAVLAVEAADHHVGRVSGFRRLLRAGFAEVEERGGILLTGFAPTRAATGYGYIKKGRRLSRHGSLAVHAVRSYREKPPLSVARRFLRSGGHLWNGCLFFWRGQAILKTARRAAPSLAGPFFGLERRLAAGRPLAGALREAYLGLEPVSIEHAVLEKLRAAKVLEGDCGWEDVGTWNGLARLLRRDGAGNAVVGRHVGIDTRDSVIVAGGGLVATLGLRELVVVRDGDAVLVLARRREGELRRLMEALEARRGLTPFL